MNSKYVKFISSSVVLRGKLDIVSISKPTIIFIPGSSGGALKERYDWLANFTTSKGYNFFRFSFRSDELNTMDKSSLEDDINDIKQALKALEEEKIDMSKIGVIAKSLGVLRIFALKESKVKCLGMLSPAIYVADESNIEILSNKKYESIANVSDFHFDKKTLLQVPSIIFYGSEDNIVNRVDINKLLNNISEAKELVLIENDGHSLDKPESHIVIEQKLSEFFSNSLK